MTLPTKKIEEMKDINNNNTNNTKKRNKSAIQKNNYSKYKNKYEKYDKINLAYELYHEYQKINFNKESIPFLERMELYSIKKFLREYKLEELIQMQTPKISEEQIINTFNRLIEDSNRRNFQSHKKKKNN